MKSYPLQTSKSFPCHNDLPVPERHFRYRGNDVPNLEPAIRLAVAFGEQLFKPDEVQAFSASLILTFDCLAYYFDCSGNCFLA